MANDSIFQRIDSLAEQVIVDLTEYRTTEDAVDPRAFRRCYIDDDRTVLVIDLERNGSARYYGGLEYVDAEHVKTIGPYVVYSAESDRIKRIVEALTESSTVDEDADDMS